MAAWAELRKLRRGVDRGLRRPRHSSPSLCRLDPSPAESIQHAPDVAHSRFAASALMLRQAAHRVLEQGYLRLTPTLRSMQGATVQTPPPDTIWVCRRSPPRPRWLAGIAEACPVSRCPGTVARHARRWRPRWRAASQLRSPGRRASIRTAPRRSATLQGNRWAAGRSLACLRHRHALACDWNQASWRSAGESGRGCRPASRPAPIQRRGRCRGWPLPAEPARFGAVP